jgi:hypothetical protein
LTSLLEAWKKLYDYRNSDDKEGLEIMFDEFGTLLIELDNQAKTAWDIYLKVKAAYDYHYPQTREFREKTPDEEWIPLSAIHEEAKKEQKP